MAAWGLGGLAFAGLILFLKEFSHGDIKLHHPLLVFPVLLVFVVLIAGSPIYQVYAWDEWTNWIGWSRQIVVTDVIFRDDMWVATRGDTPGWALLMAFPGLISGYFSTEDAWAVAIAIHIGLLALLYDIVFRSLKKLEVFSKINLLLVAWVIILGLITLELSWRLLPLLLLIEEPQYYFLAAGFLAIVIGVVEKQRDMMLFAATLLMVTAWLFKTSFVVYLPSFVVAVGFLLFFSEAGGKLNRRNLVLFLSSIFVLVALMVLWSFSAASGRCQANTSEMIIRLFSDNPVRSGLSIAEFASQVFGRMADFVLTWKLPVTIVAIIGFALFVRKRMFWIALLALGGLWIAFYIGLVSGMATCFSGLEIANLASVQRYSRVPLRLTQTIGVFMLLFAVTEYYRNSTKAIGGKFVTTGLVVVLTALGCYQIVRSVDGVKHVESRTNIDPAFKRKVQSANGDVVFLTRFYRRKGNKPVKILYFLGPPYTERVAANFHGLGNRRYGSHRHLLADSYDFKLGGKTYSGVTPSLGTTDAVAIIGSVENAVRLFPKLGSVLKNCVAGNSGYLLYRMKPRAELVCRPRMAP
jgi:hypothetical protein